MQALTSRWPLSLPIIFIEIEGGKTTWGFNENTYKGIVAALSMLSYMPIGYYIEVLQYSICIYPLNRDLRNKKVLIEYENINLESNIEEQMIVLLKIVLTILMYYCMEIIPKLPTFASYFCNLNIESRGAKRKGLSMPICEDCFHISNMESLVYMYDPDGDAYVLNLYENIESIILYYDHRHCIITAANL